MQLMMMFNKITLLVLLGSLSNLGFSQVADTSFEKRLGKFYLEVQNDFYQKNINSQQPKFSYAIYKISIENNERLNVSIIQRDTSGLNKALAGIVRDHAKTLKISEKNINLLLPVLLYDLDEQNNKLSVIDNSLYYDINKKMTKGYLMPTLLFGYSARIQKK